MKILVLTPEIHFHSPVVIRALFSDLSPSEHEFRVILTPKLSKNSRSPASLRRILRDSGLRYIFFMGFMKLKFDIFAIFEKLRGIEIGARYCFSPVDACRGLGIGYERLAAVNSPESLEKIREYGPDLIISIFFNQILKRELLDIPKYGAINLHPSSLPEYRGMSPIIWMLADGVKEGGITVHYMDEGIDSGDIIARKRFDIAEKESFFSVYRKAAETGAELLSELLKNAPPLPDGEKQPVEVESYGPAPGEVFRAMIEKHGSLRFGR